MAQTPSLPNLHDATLIAVRVNWENALVTFELEPLPGAHVELTAREIRELNLTHREEWGPSVSVNSVEARTADGGETVLEIQMQSGDDIIVVCGSIDFA